MQRGETDVCIVGAGPVGLTAAMALASRGVRVTIIEMRTEAEISSPKSNHVSARSMEIYRRLGVSETIRAQGLPDDFPNDGVYATRFTGFEFTRFRMPSRRDRFNDAGYDDGELPSPERAARVSQMYLAPILLEHASNYPDIQILNGTSFKSLEEDQAGVTVHAESRSTGETIVIRCQYLIGADGGRSDVRRALSINLHGEDNLVRARSRMFRAPGLLELCGYPPAWMNWFYVDGKWSSAIAIDGRELWLMHNFIPPTMAFEDFDIDKSMREALGVGPEFKYEIVRDEDWVGRRLVADRFQVGRSFICGDAAHLWVPYGGYGMNAGIADADNLAWMISAVLKGWAPPALLEAHERERRPITERVSRFAAEVVDVLEYSESAVIEEDSPEGARVRKKFGERIRAFNLRSMVPTGLNFGYYYDESPLIVYDGATPPPFTMGDYTPTTIPGCRLPHFWLRDGRSLYDVLPDGYTLLRFDPGLDISELTEAARRRSVPLTILDVEPGKDFDPDVYRERLILARPDQHIAWRGDCLPADCGALVDRIRGAASSDADINGKVSER